MRSAKHCSKSAAFRERKAFNNISVLVSSIVATIDPLLYFDLSCGLAKIQQECSDKIRKLYWDIWVDSTAVYFSAPLAQGPVKFNRAMWLVNRAVQTFFSSILDDNNIIITEQRAVMKICIISGRHYDKSGSLGQGQNHERWFRGEPVYNAAFRHPWDIPQPITKKPDAKGARRYNGAWLGVVLRRQLLRA